MFRKNSIVACFVMLAAFCGGANDYIVSVANGNDGNSGKLDSPLKTIMAAVKKAKAGDSIIVANGVYREQIVFGFGSKGRKGAPITLRAKSGAKPVVKGSDVVTRWEKYKGDIWMRKHWLHNSQQVFADGKVLQQIGFHSKAYPKTASDGNWMLRVVGKDLNDITENSFYCDVDKHVLYVWLKGGADPNKKRMEASVRMYLVNANNSKYITVKGITFRHSNTSAFKQGGAALEMGSYCVIQDCDIQWCDFAGISPGYRQCGTQIVDCVVSNNGDSGIGPCEHPNFLIKNCRVEGNNYRQFNQTWHAGGIKVIGINTWGRIENCVIGNNLGTGLWFDSCRDLKGFSVVENNYIYNNARQGGIMIELSDHVSIINNVLYNNDQFGIHYVCSSYGKIIGNMIVGQRDFIALDVSGPRNNSEHKLCHNTVLRNSVIDSACKYDLHMIQPDGKYVFANKCDYNFFARNGGPKLRYNAGGRKKWRDILLTGDLDKWIGATGYDKHSVVIDRQKLKDVKIRTK